MRYENIQVLVLSTAMLFTVVIGFIVYFVILYRSRQERNEQEQQELKSAFEQELLKTRIEMQEQTLAYISREIHDNITQVLSFVKLNLGMIPVADENVRAKIGENRELVAQTISDLRNLSKSLSYDYITAHGLVKTIETEAERINSSGLIDALLFVDGDIYSIGAERELVLFRIFQEALNNALKYSSAKHLKITLQYHPDLFNLTLEDDGVGFSPDLINNSKGLGLKNIHNRAALIGAAATIYSSQGNGCRINITLNPDGYQRIS